MSRDLELGIRITADGRLVVTEAGKAVTALKGIEAQTEQIAKSSARMASSMTAALSSLGREGSKRIAEIDKQTAAWNRLSAAGQSALDQLHGKTQQATASTSALANAIKGVGLVAAGAALVGVAKEAAGVAVQMDRLKSILEAGAGSAQQAAKDMDFVRSTARALGLELTSSAEAFGKLAASAKGTELAGQGVRDIFAAVAKASASLGLSVDEANGALLAISQMISKGTVSAEELRGQLGERLPGAFQIAARAMGVTTAELDKMLQSGDVVATDFLPKFARELDRAFDSGRFDRAQHEMNRLTNAWTEFKRAFVNTDFVAGTVRAITAGIETIVANVNAGKAALDDIDRATRKVLRRQPAQPQQPIDQTAIAAAFDDNFRPQTFLAPRGGVYTFGQQSMAFAAQPIDAAAQKVAEADAKAQAKANEELTRSKIELFKAQKDYNQALALEAELKGLSGEQAEQYIQTELATLRAKESSVASHKAVSAAKKEENQIDQLKKQLLDAIKTPQDEYNLRVDQAAKLLALGKINQEQYNLALTQYRDALYGSIQLQDAHIQAFQDQQARQKQVLDDLAQESELLKLSNEDREIRTRQIQANVAASSQEGQEIAKRVRENVSLKKAQTEVANASESWSQAMEQGVRRIDDSLQQMWEDWISGSSNAMDSVKKLFQSLLAELAHAAITRPIIMALMGGGSGTAQASQSFGGAIVDQAVSWLIGGDSSGGGLLSSLFGGTGVAGSSGGAGGGGLLSLLSSGGSAASSGYSLLSGMTSPALAAYATNLGNALGIGGNAINYLSNAAYYSPYLGAAAANAYGVYSALNTPGAADWAKGVQAAYSGIGTAASLFGYGTAAAGATGSLGAAGAAAAAMGGWMAAGSLVGTGLQMLGVRGTNATANMLGPTTGAALGTMIFPGIGTIIGAIVGALGSMLFKTATPKAYAGYRFGQDNSLTPLWTKQHAGGSLKSLQQIGASMASPFVQLEEALGVELGQFDVGLKQKGGRFVLTGADEAGQFFRLDTKFKNKGKNNYIDRAFDQFLAALVKRQSVLAQFDDLFLRGALRFANGMKDVQEKFKEAAEFNLFVGARTELSDSLEALRQEYRKQLGRIGQYLYGNDLQYKLDELNAAFADKFGKTVDAFAGQIRQLTGESDGAAEALKSLKEQLKQIQVQSKELGAFAKKNGLAFTAPDIQAIGAKSVENLIQQLMTPFYESYLTPEEQLRRGILDRRGQVAALGLPGDLTAQNFRQRFESALPGLSVVQIETWMKAAKALSEIQKAEQELAAIRLQSANEARTAYVGALEREGSALVTARRQWLDLAAGFNQFRARLQTSELSPLSPGGRLEAARGRFESLATQARLGDLGAIAELQSSSETFLRASRDYYASSEQYYRDFQRVEAVLSETEALSVRHARLAEEQLSALLDMLQQLGSVETAAKLAGDVVAQATGTSSLYLSQAVQQSAGSVIAVQSAGLASQIGALTGVQASVQAGLSGVQALLVQGQASELAQTQSLVALAQQQVEQTRQAWEMAAEQAGSQVGVEQAQLEQLKLLNAAIAAIAGREAQALIPQAPPPPPPEPILPSIDQFRSGIPPAPAGVDPGRWQAAWAKRDAEHRAKFKASLWTKKSGFWDPSIGNTIIREAFLEARGYAQGGLASGWAVVGEEGPELVRFNRPGFVHTAAQSRELVSGEIVRELRQLAELLKQQTRDLVEAQKRVHQELRRVA